MGYLKKGSMSSIISSSIFSFILLVCAYGIQKNKIFFYKLTLALSGFLTVFFTYRYYLSQKVMPAGIVVILSIIVFLLTFQSFKVLRRNA